METDSAGWGTSGRDLTSNAETEGTTTINKRKLTPEQRNRALKLEDSVIEDTNGAAYEIIALRDDVARLNQELAVFNTERDKFFGRLDNPGRAS